MSGESVVQNQNPGFFDSLISEGKAAFEKGKNIIEQGANTVKDVGSQALGAVTELGKTVTG